MPVSMMEVTHQLAFLCQALQRVAFENASVIAGRTLKNLR